MPADISTVHINKALSSLSVQLNSDPADFLLGRACARREVKDLSNSFYTYGREGASHAPIAGQLNVKFLPDVTAPGAEAVSSEYTLTNSAYQCHRYAKRTLVTDAEILKSDSPLSPIQDAAMILASEIRNDAEGVLAAVIGDYDNYNASARVQLTTGANGTNWNVGRAGTGSNPMTDIQTARIYVDKAIQRKANVLILSAPSLYYLADHPDLSGILQYTDSTYLQDDGLPPALRGLRLTSGRAVWNTAAEGAAYSGGFIFLDGTDSNYAFAIAAYIPPGGAIGPRGFASFIWFDGVDETTGEHGITIRAYRDEGRRGFWVEAAMTFDIKPGIVDGSSKITGAYMISRTDIP